MKRLLAGLFALVIASCATTPEPNTIEQRAGQLLGYCTISLELAAEIVEIPETPDDVVFAIADGAEVVKPLCDEVATAAKALARAIRDAGGSQTADEVIEQKRELEDAVDAAAPAVEDFNETIKGTET